MNPGLAPSTDTSPKTQDEVITRRSPTMEELLAMVGHRRSPPNFNARVTKNAGSKADIPQQVALSALHAKTEAST